MDQGTLVGEQIADGRRFVERFAADGNLVQAAFWAETAEEGLWFLYLATETYDRDGPAAAYRAVHASLDKLGQPGIFSSEIKVISPKNPIAKDVLALIARHPGRFAFNLAGQALGSVAVDQVYIYPPKFFTFPQANPMTTEEISREILRLLNRGPSILQPSRVSLKDGMAFTGVPFALELGTQNALVVRFLADGEAAPRVVQLDEIASII
ncbi:MAG: hypothetical protein JO112_21665 [Planctomycetes bacterium]|nr:hypothetical protein [Planctomycetota bacterium]